MPKHEAGTPKAIANRIKAKGLQKLRWYCQMCQKQCRDENGFKCHTTSESHQRQLLLFADNPDNYIDSFSKEFKDGFVELLSRRFGTKRVNANMVYQEYIQDRHHQHMNSTEWETLTDFIKYLGREGVCTADQTEKGWFITYIDRDPETIQRQEAQAKKEKMDKDDLERTMEFINKQVERARNQERPIESPTPTSLLRQSDDEKVEFKLPIGLAQKIRRKLTSSTSSNPLTGAGSKMDEKRSRSESEPSAKKKKTNLEELIIEEESKKEKLNRKDYWLAEDIVVKIVTKEFGDKYYKQKAVVKEVQNRYVAVVKLCDSADVIKLGQDNLETVIPALGRPVKILNGAYRGHHATLLSLNEKRFCCSIKIDKGPLKGRLVDGVQYEDISKIDMDG